MKQMATDARKPLRMPEGSCLGWLAAAFSIVVWSITYASTRVLLRDFSSLEIQIVRFTLAWAALALFGAASRRTSPPRGAGNEPLFAAMGFTGIAAYQFLENCAIYYTNASNVAILVSFAPIMTAVVTRMFVKDKSMSASFVAGSLVAVGGVAVVSLGAGAELELRPVGDLMAIGAMASWGGYSMLVDVANRRGVPPALAMRRAFVWSLLMMAPLVAWGATEAGARAVDGVFAVTFDCARNAERFSRAANWVNFGFLGVFASAASFALWNYACRSLGVVRASVGLYLTPVIGVAFAVAFLGEALTASGVCGGALILAGVYVASRTRQKERQ